MKRFLPLFLIALAFSSCQEDVKSNKPGFQAMKDDLLWRANDARASVSSNGELTITGLAEYDEVSLNTSSKNPGIYVLGTTNSANSATYESNFNDLSLSYATNPVAGPVYGVELYAVGTGYTSDCDLQTNGQYTCNASHNTTGGTGSGLTVSIVADANGSVTKVVRVVSRGNGYLPGDIVTVTQGDLNCKVRVVNVQTSNGEIEITDYDSVNLTVSGKFKFNAVNVDNNPFGVPVVNFQYGEFYEVPILPFAKK